MGFYWLCTSPARPGQLGVLASIWMPGRCTRTQTRPGEAGRGGGALKLHFVLLLPLLLLQKYFVWDAG